MKQVILSVALLLITGVSISQEREKRIKFKEGLVAICTSSEMSIKGYDGDEVIIRNLNPSSNYSYIYTTKDGQQSRLSSDSLVFKSYSIYSTSDTKKDLEKGLKPLGETSTNPADNLFLDILKKPGELLIKDLQMTTQGQNGNTSGLTSFVSQNNKFEILIPNTVRLVWNAEGCAKKNSNTFFIRTDSNPLQLSDFKGEAEVSTTYKSIKLSNVTGPVIANSIGGNITVVFDTSLPSKLYSLVSNSGYVDVTIPSRSSVMINATGERILSNIDFKILIEEVSNSSKHMELQLNSGKAKMKIDAGSGSIYLRDSK